ncbi:MAG: LapA family protein [Alphaproteobacteria bacterium]|nr:LapA family protein [Alphaproteobacteria bacterium]MBQ8346911.1 LapA family protein [Alphaproteobacteria bacterium]
MKIIHFIFSCVVLFFTVSFAVSNKQEFALTLWPFPFEITLPVSFIVLAFALLFFIFGGIYSWILTIPVRNERYQQAKKIKELTRKITELETDS